jgi:hypothetical protein
MSVTLNASAVETHSIGGQVVETNSQGAVSFLSIDFNGNILTLNTVMGSLSGNNLTPGAHSSQDFSLSINLSSGAWTNNLTAATGTLAPTALSSLVSVLKGLRNNAENFLVNQGMIAGVQVPWA